MSENTPFDCFFSALWAVRPDRLSDGQAVMDQYCGDID